MASSDDFGFFRSDSITPGSPEPEHLAFILLGMVATLAVLVHVYLEFVG